MLKINFNPHASDEERRSLIFSGALLFYTATPESLSLVGYAESLIREAFDGRDPEHAQETMPVSDFINIVGPLKTKFTNSSVTKDLLSAYLRSMGVDAKRTYFDVPRLRVVPHSDYLKAGVSYAYKAHRDIWYSSPTAQLNWWLPVMEVVPERTMAFFPDYFERPLPNSSADFDYGEWTTFGRSAAISQSNVDTRKHPLPMAPVEAEEFRYGAAAGDTLVFSASHLHATAPNTSGKTRFSIDFRTVNESDLAASRGAPNVDSRSTGSTIGDFMRIDDLSTIPTRTAA